MFKEDPIAFEKEIVKLLTPDSIYYFYIIDTKTKRKSMWSYYGKVLLIVNIAREWGMTPHMKSLQELHDKYKDKGLRVLGFSCNQFG